MPSYLLRLECPTHGEGFLVWSTIVDAPVTYAMDEAGLRAYLLEEFGRAGEAQTDSRIARCREKGTSALNYRDAEDVIVGNRAGQDESELSMAEIVVKYCCVVADGEPA